MELSLAAPMTDVQWKRVWELYEVAQHLSDTELDPFVSGLTDDPEVVEELRILLSTLPAEAAAVSEESSIGAYKVLHLLGRGATADVYAALDKRLDRMVALKFLKGDRELLARRFLREAQSVSALNHPNIVTLFEVLDGPSGPVLAMELVEGVALRNRCAVPMPEGEVIRIGVQIAQALAAAHEKGFVHRDLKPENIMLRPDGYVKVLDFGLVRRAEFSAHSTNTSSTAGLPVGTLRYMSPEQCRGESATPKSDVFALGLILYELLAGRHPFAASEGLDVAYALVNEKAQPLPGVSSGLRLVVEQMMEKDAARRPDAREVAARLAALGSSGAIPAYPAAPTADPGNRRRFLQAGAGMLAVAAGGAWWWRGRRRPPAGTLLKGGLIRDPAFSPDGDEIVFSWQKPGGHGYQLYNLSLSAGAEPKALTSGVAEDFDPVWSPDGSKICFIRRGKGESAIYLIDRETGQTRRVTTIQYDSTWASRLGWLGPGRISVTDKPGAPGYRAVEVDLETGAKRRLLPGDVGTGEGTARLSPDGKELLFGRAFGMNSADLFVRPVAGGEERRITFDEKPKTQYRWSRDGSTIVYRSSKPMWKLWEVGRDGKGDRELPVPRTTWGNFDVHSATGGKRALVLAQLPDTFSIWKAVRKPGGAFAPPQLLISAGAGIIDSSPIISPDASRIAFLSSRTGDVEIWVADADGNNPIQLTRIGSQYVAAPAWSPDSRRILSAARLTGRPEAFLIDARADAKLEVIPSLERNINEPQFTPPDHRSISYSGAATGRSELYRSPIPGAGASLQPEQLTRNGCSVYRYSPDGRWIYFVRANEVSGLFRIPSAGGPEELVLPEVSSQLYRGWAIARSGIYYTVEVEGAAGRWEIRHYDPVKKVRTFVLPVQHPLPRWSGTLSVSPDESWLVFPQHEPVVGELVYDPDWK